MPPVQPAPSSYNIPPRTPRNNGASGGANAANNVSRRNRSRLQREYVSGGVNTWYGKNKATALPWSFDDVTCEYGLEIYEQMVLDSQVSACGTLFKAAIIEEGMTISPAVTDDKDPAYDKAVEICDAARAMVDSMDTSLDEVMWDLLNCIYFGNKVGELIYRIEDGFLNLKKIKVKPGKSVAFVVDEYLNVLGLLADTTGMGNVSTGSFAAISSTNQIISREKFIICTFRPKDSDPRGSSILRSAYDAWWRKQQLMPEYMKFMAQFAGPSVIGFTAPDQEDRDPTPEEIEEGINPPTATEEMLAALMAWHNGSAAAFPGGAKVDAFLNETEGVAFTNFFASCNLEITKAMLTQQLATEEGQFMARAAAQVHADVLDTIIRQGKRAMARAFAVDILRRWVGYNYGPKYLPLTPRASLGYVEQRDMAALMNAIAGLKRAGYFVDEQLPAIDKSLGFPIRSAEAMEADKADKLALAQASKAAAPSTPVQDNADNNNNDNNSDNNEEDTNNKAVEND